MRESRRLISVALLAAFAVALMGPLAWAAPVPSQAVSPASPTAGEQPVQVARELVKGRLMDFGLSEADAGSRLALLTDQEVRAIAADLDSLQAAGALGDQQWDTVTVLLLLILVAILAD